MNEPIIEGVTTTWRMLAIAGLCGFTGLFTAGALLVWGWWMDISDKANRVR